MFWLYRSVSLCLPLFLFGWFIFVSNVYECFACMHAYIPWVPGHAYVFRDRRVPVLNALGLETQTAVGSCECWESNPVLWETVLYIADSSWNHGSASSPHAKLLKLQPERQMLCSQVPCAHLDLCFNTPKGAFCKITFPSQTLDAVDRLCSLGHLKEKKRLALKLSTVMYGHRGIVSITSFNWDRKGNLQLWSSLTLKSTIHPVPHWTIRWLSFMSSLGTRFV